MPFEFSWESQGVSTRFSGTVTGAELLHLIYLIRTNSRFRGMRYHIVHCARAEAFEVSRDDLKVLGTVLRAAERVNPGILVALVARGRRALAFARLCMDSQASPSPIDLFTRTDDARAWIEAKLAEDG